VFFVKLFFLYPNKSFSLEKVKNPAPFGNEAVCGDPHPAANRRITCSSKEKAHTGTCMGLSRMAPHWEYQRTFPIILPNIIHGCKKKDL